MQSRATAAVQDWPSEPNGSPVKGSKYSARPPAESWCKAARRSASARPASPSRTSERQRSQVTTGQMGPRQ
ncbi:MAG: hypothetical protein ICV58_00920 [Rubrobacteraceae bacterium]|nr:hypothetical protein [Rubrobacteraceae bacterium]